MLPTYQLVAPGFSITLARILSCGTLQKRREANLKRQIQTLTQKLKFSENTRATLAQQFDAAWKAKEQAEAEALSQMSTASICEFVSFDVLKVGFLSDVLKQKALKQTDDTCAATTKRLKKEAAARWDEEEHLRTIYLSCDCLDWLTDS